MGHHEEQEILRLLVYLSNKLTFLERQVEKILDIVETQVAFATFATLTILDSKGNILMPATLSVGATATAILHEFVSQGGTELKPVGPVSYSSSDATIATVDPASGLITAIAAGTATITGTDAGNGLTASDSVSDTPLVATVATLVITPN